LDVERILQIGTRFIDIPKPSQGVEIRLMGSLNLEVLHRHFKTGGESRRMTLKQKYQASA
jgi:hypothetical protein